MILDHIDHIGNYIGISKNLDDAIFLIQNQKLETAELGKVTINEDQLFYLVQAYEPKSFDKVNLEAHLKYIDLQLMVEGDEMMAYGNINALQLQTPYNESIDAQFFSGEVQKIHVKKDYFAIFFPHDAHQPGLAIEEARSVKKVVVKIACKSEA